MKPRAARVRAGYGLGSSPHPRPLPEGPEGEGEGEGVHPLTRALLGPQSGERVNAAVVTRERFHLQCAINSSLTTDHSIRIGEDGGRAALLVDGVVQSISPEDGLNGGGYWAAMVPNERPRAALILGLGGGTISRLLQVRWGELRMVGVDDDVSILETANAVGWLPLRGLEIVVADAFEYVQSCSERFDYVAVDLFRGARLARRAFGKPFLRNVRDLLQPHGRLAVNLFSDYRAPERIQRIATFFEIRGQVGVGGNLVVHARRRRP